MDTQTAVKLVTQTFEADFEAVRFRTFTRNLLNAIDETKAFGPLQGAYIWEAFRAHVHQYWRVGTYTDPGGEKIDVLIVRLEKPASLERARTLQRNFVARYLKERDAKDAALVAYYTDDTSDWRFSLVKMEYQVEVGEKGLKVQEVLTPARRYSFLVGANEPNHTAQQQLVPLLKETRRNPTLAQLEAAFNIESVTREFFEKYKALFLDLKEELDALVSTTPAIQAEFDRTGIATANFAKKLLGQLVFLTFLQKKGWLGVVPGARWGSGPQDFLRRLLAGDYVRYESFFNEVLEPLFYEALAIERPEHHYPRLDCRVPFLNGGLFEPVGGYDWRGVDIPLSNARFRAILDTFALYNFTVREDEPFEKEVAVDPEMLGKVFENLLDVQDRKSKGAFYTPREIVHYMCQESLINYLDTTLNTPANSPASEGASTTPLFPSASEGASTPLFSSAGRGTSTSPLPPVHGGIEGGNVDGRTAGGNRRIPRDDLDTLIRQGEMALEHDATTATKPHETDAYAFALPAAVREQAAALDAALAEIKICDPAIGSGAFPVGMMHEIVKARTVLTTYLTPPSNSLPASEPPPAGGGTKGGEACGGTKGGNVDGGTEGGRPPYALKRQAIQNALYGVDIDAGAVDIAKLRLWLSLVVDEESYEDIQPLPNLDYKIVCGNSLLGFPENWQSRATEKVERLKRAYFSETDPARKATLRAQIDAAMQRHLANAEQVIGYPVNFDFRLFFSEVFHEKDGFDVVIGNPPYVRHERIRDQKPALKEAHPQVYRGTADLYVYFYAQGFKVLRERGCLAFITSNKWLRTAYGKKLRQFLLEGTSLFQLIDFKGKQIFDATVDTDILICVKESPSRDHKLQTGNNLPNANNPLIYIPQNSLSEDLFYLGNIEERALKTKIEASGISLREWDISIHFGIKTGRNKAFIIDTATKERLCRQDPRSSEIIKPLLRGRDLERWYINFAEQYLIKIESSQNVMHPWSNKTEEEAEKIFAQTYPAIYAHFEPHRARLIKRYDQGDYFWELRSCAYWEEFEREKIIFQEMVQESTFMYDEEGRFYCLDTGRIITGQNLKFLLCILNSKLFFYSVKIFYGGGTLGEKGVRMKHTFFEEFPAPQIPETEQQPFVALVNRILDAKAADVSGLEAEIDRLVYQLYGLTDDEIAIIEENTKE